jgi:hypothetical protein
MVGSAGSCSGAAFSLLKPARETTTVAIGEWEIEVCRRSSGVVARGGSERSAADATRSALAHVQMALDLMCVRGSNSLALRDPEDEYIVWWPDGTGALTIRIVSVTNLAFGIRMGGIKVGPAGEKDPAPHPSNAPDWHPSFRYFRLSQASDDLFDAYRNAYLALEAVLSEITPQKLHPNGRRESERDWLTRALVGAKLAPEGDGALADELYRGVRASLSHAKSGRDLLLPYNNAEREKVLASLHRVVGLYLNVATSHLGVTPHSGGVTEAGWLRMFTPILDDVVVSVSDDESPWNKAETNPAPAGGMLRELRRIEGSVVPSPWFLMRLAWAATSRELAGLPFVRRIVGVHEGVTAFATVLDERLYLAGEATLQYEFGARGLNAHQPRQHYPL